MCICKHIKIVHFYSLSYGDIISSRIGVLGRTGAPDINDAGTPALLLVWIACMDRTPARNNNKEYQVQVGNDITLEGELDLPDNPGGIVLFVHGSGSSRHSPRNKYVAEVLNDGGIATLLIDLLTADEEIIDRQTTHLRFNIDLLAERLSLVTNWVKGQSGTGKLHLGYFGASTGAAAALVAAAKHPEAVEAIVSRGGRPDLAGTWLAPVQAPTLLIVGGNDPIVIELNRQAASQMRTTCRLEIIPGAGHLFEEPGTLERAAIFAREWFEEYLVLANRHVA